MFTCSDFLPVSFSCVYFLFSPYVSSGNLLRVGISWSSAPLWIVWPSASILRLLLEKMPTRRQHFFMPFAHGNSSLCGYPGLVVNESKMRKRKPLKAFVSLAFEVFSLSETSISYLRLFTPLVVIAGKQFLLPFHRYLEVFSSSYCHSCF